MVLFFSSDVWQEPVTIYMGKDKFENEDLIRYALEKDIWFHVDKLSSAHIYLRLPDSIPSWEEIPESLVTDCAQLTKANSIQGNKRDDITIIYTPSSNLLKNESMDTGQVAFKNQKLVKRVHIPTRVNAIVNRLQKTKVEREVDHEAEKIERMKEESRVRREAAVQKRKEDLQLARKRKEEAEARSYSNLFTPEAIAAAHASKSKSNDDGESENGDSDGSNISFM